MSYERTYWEDAPSASTPINAENLNKIETALVDLDSGKANKSSDENKILLASSWLGSSAPYTLELAVEGVTNISRQEWLPGLEITPAQLLALQSANIIDGGQSAGFVTFKAFGIKPTIDIPVIVIKRGD